MSVFAKNEVNEHGKGMHSRIDRSLVLPRCSTRTSPFDGTQEYFVFSGVGLPASFTSLRRIGAQGDDVLLVGYRLGSPGGLLGDRRKFGRGS